MNHLARLFVLIVSRFLLLFLVAARLGLLGGCTRQDVATPPLPADSPEPAASPSSSSSTALAPSTSRQYAALPQLSARDSAVLGLLNKMCATAVVANDTQTTVGCACCPPFEACRAKGRPPDVLLDGHVFPLRHTLEGSFSAPGVKEIAAVFEGCEPGMDNRGGTMIYRAVGNELSPIAYRSAINPDRCVALRRSNRSDLLACLTLRGMGSTSYHLLEWIDLAPDPARVHSLAHLDRDRACLKEEGPYVIIEPGDMIVSDVSGDGVLDLEIEVTIQSGVLSTSELATCTSDAIELPTNLSPGKRRTFVFLGDGITLHPDAATAAELDRLRALQAQEP